MTNVPRMLRTVALIRRALAAVIMTGLSIALIVWATSLLASRYWIGGIVFYILGAFFIALETWLFVVLVRARRKLDRLSHAPVAETASTDS